MAWTIEIENRPRKQLGKFAKADAARIISFLEDRLGQLDHPRQIGAALEGPRFQHLWRYRVGDYRIICDIQDSVVVILVVEIGHHSEVYR